MRRPLTILAALLVSSCSLALGPPGEWIPWTDVDGPLRPEVSPPPAGHDAGETLRVATFNVHYGDDIDAIARAILDNPALAAAEVLLLQEIRSFPDEDASRAARLAAALGMGYAYAPARPHKTGTHGNAILSRIPFDNVSVMELPRAQIALGSERRIAMTADLQVGGAVLRIVNVHLDTRLNISDRVEQLRPAVIDAPPRAIVAGDFNTNPFIWTGNTVPDVRTLAIADSDQAPLLDSYMAAIGFENPTSGLGPTAPVPVFAVHLDSIFTRGLASAGGAVERGVTVSDHWPVWTDLRLDAPPDAATASAEAD